LFFTSELGNSLRDLVFLRLVAVTHLFEIGAQFRSFGLYHLVEPLHVFNGNRSDGFVIVSNKDGLAQRSSNKRGTLRLRLRHLRQIDIVFLSDLLHFVVAFLQSFLLRFFFRCELSKATCQLLLLFAPLITSTRRELVDLCHSEEIKGSPFFNIFASVFLRPLSRQDAAALVDGYLNEADLSVSPDEKELVIALGGGHPFFIQMAGHYLVEAKYTNLPASSLPGHVISAFEEQADPHFTYLWSHCSESQKIILLAAISLNRQKPSKKTVPTIENLTRLHSRAPLDVPELVKRGMLLKREGTENYHLFSPSLERWIGREIAAAPEEQETPDSVQEWVSQSGQSLGTPVQGVLPKFKRKYWPLVSSVLKELSFELAASATFELLIKALT